MINTSKQRLFSRALIAALIAAISAITPGTTAAQTTIDFESLLPSANSFNDGNPSFNPPGSPLFSGTSAPFDPTDPFAGTTFTQSATIGSPGASVSLLNEFTQTPSFSFWSGFAVSNVVDTTTPGFTNQYAAFPGGGASSTTGATVANETYAIAFTQSDVSATDDANGIRQPQTASVLNLGQNSLLHSIDVANTTFVERFTQAGLDGLDPNFSPAPAPAADFDSNQLFGAGDFFRLSITGYAGANATGTQTGVVELDLANFDDGIFLEDWQTLDLSGLGTTRSLSFATTSSQISDIDFGGGFTASFSDVPAFVAIDNIVIAAAAVPEPSSLMILLSIGGLAVTGRRRSTK